MPFPSLGKVFCCARLPASGRGLPHAVAAFPADEQKDPPQFGDAPEARAASPIDAAFLDILDFLDQPLHHAAVNSRSGLPTIDEEPASQAAARKALFRSWEDAVASLNTFGGAPSQPRAERAAQRLHALELRTAGLMQDLSATAFRWHGDVAAARAPVFDALRAPMAELRAHGWLGDASLVVHAGLNAIVAMCGSGMRTQDALRCHDDVMRNLAMLLGVARTLRQQLRPPATPERHSPVAGGATAAAERVAALLMVLRAKYTTGRAMYAFDAGAAAVSAMEGTAWRGPAQPVRTALAALQASATVLGDEFGIAATALIGNSPAQRVRAARRPAREEEAPNAEAEQDIAVLARGLGRDSGILLAATLAAADAIDADAAYGSHDAAARTRVLGAVHNLHAVASTLAEQAIDLPVLGEGGFWA